MKTLVIGSGGREHALLWALRNSGMLYAVPGNGGTKDLAENIPIAATDVTCLLDFVEANNVDFTVVGPEDPLGLDIVNIFRARGHKIFGPTGLAAEATELSKAKAKDMMVSAGVPTSPFRVFTDSITARAYVRAHGVPIVVKASGPALGKGAYVCETINEAMAAIDNIMVRKVHGKAGDVVVIEDFLPGPEVSVQAFCDGKSFSLFPVSQDHKRAFNGDKGPNTGGMGAISPVPWFNPNLFFDVGPKIVAPIMEELACMGRSYTGFIYPGLKVVPPGRLKVLEVNARSGDPETQVYMRRLKTDLLKIMEACMDGKLAETNIEWDPRPAACVVLASGGYPGDYKKGFPITGIKEAEALPGVVVFHAGTKFENGTLVTSGGRVLSVTATGDTLEDAIKTANVAAKLIKFEGKQFRTDIGAKSLAMA